LQLFIEFLLPCDFWLKIAIKMYLQTTHQDGLFTQITFKMHENNYVNWLKEYLDNKGQTSSQRKCTNLSKYVLVQRYYVQ
jgi:hypothetical protein